MTMWIDRAKRYGEILGVVMLFSGVMTTLVHLTGGSLPPWVPAAFAQQYEAKQEALTTNQLLLERELWSDKLDMTRKELAANPSSESAAREVRDLEFKVRVIESQLTKATGVPAP